MLEGEMWFELEGEAPRVIKAGEPFWEPGGDVIHYRDGNNRSDTSAPVTDWRDDPAEIEYEEANLRTLRGAIEALEGRSHGGLSTD